MSGFKANPNDFVIVFMGPTGSGKSNFINLLSGNAEKVKAAKLKSATQNITPYPIQYRDRRIMLVDTPGFDDTYRPDTEILRMIADWLLKKYPDGHTLKVAGIIYHHRITDNRMSGSAYKNLQMFGRLCGNVPLYRARLVTTMWDIVKDKEIAERKLNELTGGFWKPLIDEGAVPERSENNPASAFQIVDKLMAVDRERGHGEDELLLLQEELVEQQKRLNETEAGKVLYSRLQRLLAEQRITLKELSDEAKNDPTLAKSLQAECDKINAMLQQTSEEMQAMKIPIGRRLSLWFSGLARKPHAKAIKLDEPPPLA